VRLLLTRVLPSIEGAMWKIRQLEEGGEGGGFGFALQFLQCRIDLIRVSSSSSSSSSSSGGGGGQ